MNKSEKIRLYYGIALSVLTAIVGILFIVQIANMYYSNGATQGVYTLDNIRKYMLLPFIFLIVWIAAIIAGYVLSVVFPAKEKSRKFVDNKKILGLLKSKVPTVGKSEGFEEARSQIAKQEVARKCVWGVACAVLLAGAIAILIYAYTPAHYKGASYWRADVLALVRNTIFWIAAGLICTIGAVVFEGISIKREVEYVKKAIATGDRNSIPPQKVVAKNFAIVSTIIAGLVVLSLIVLYIIAPSVMTDLIAPVLNGAAANTTRIIVAAMLFLAIVVVGLTLGKVVKKYVPEKANNIMLLCTRIAIAVVAISFIIADAVNEFPGAQDVLKKAVAICTECIGLG